MKQNKNMKSKTKQTKIDRSAAKWLPGAIALAATTASSQAAIVQITLTGNKLSSTSAGGNSLDADLTGDGVDDVAFTGLAYNANKAYVFVDGLVACAYFSPPHNAFFIAAGNGVAMNWPTSQGYIPVQFSDDRIHGGADTAGWLHVFSRYESQTSHTVQLMRLIFDDSSQARPPEFDSRFPFHPEWQVAAVPEPSGFLATSLLLGAAGLIRRRQARAA